MSYTSTRSAVLDRLRAIRDIADRLIALVERTPLESAVRPEGLAVAEGILDRLHAQLVGAGGAIGDADFVIHAHAREVERAAEESAA